MMGSQSFDDVSSFLLTTSSNSFPSLFGTNTTYTLTPTTLKSINDCLGGHGDELCRQMVHEHQAGFVPPDVDFSSSILRNSQPQQQLLSQSLQSHGQENVSNNFLHSASDNDEATDDDLDDESTSFSTGDYSQCPGDSASNDSQETFSTRSSTRRSSTNANNNHNNNNNSTVSNNNNSSKSSSRAKTRTAVRKTRGARNEEKLPPEEENRRRMRRERNKQAAARCRKRRLDHTTELTKITDGLEEEKRKLQQQLAELQRQQEQLEFCMKSHMSECRKNHRPAAKSEPQQQPSSQSQSVQLPSMAKSRRPSTLPLGPSFTVSSNTSSSSNNSSPAVTSSSSNLPGPNDSLIPIQTPSNGLFVDFRGLTPLLDTPSAGGFMPTVSCGGQIRSQFSVTSESMVTSPDSGPTPAKLVSL